MESRDLRDEFIEAPCEAAGASGAYRGRFLLPSLVIEHEGA